MFHTMIILNSSRFFLKLYHILKESEGEDPLDNGRFGPESLELEECFKELEETWKERLEEVKELGDVGKVVGHGDV
jgi:hypothetical protein